MQPILRAIPGMLRPVPFPLTVELLVLGAPAIFLGLFLTMRGTLPRWLPSGFVDQSGQRAVLSRPVYRILGVTAVLTGCACLLLALGQRGITILLALVLTVIALICAVPAAV